MKVTQPHWMLGAIVLVGGQMLGQETPASTQETQAKQWSFSLTADGYVVPHNQFFVSPVFTADREWLHLEARYNYEAQDTGSLWVGHNFNFGQKLMLEATPMIGGVLGNTPGIAPGYRMSLSYKRLEKFELFSQGEYLFDTKDTSESFFYNWSQLTYSPAEWFHAGIVVQKTKAYHTSFNVQRGLVAGFSHKKVSFTTYVFNFGWTEPTVVLEIAAEF